MVEQLIFNSSGFNFIIFKCRKEYEENTKVSCITETFSPSVKEGSLANKKPPRKPGTV